MYEKADRFDAESVRSEWDFAAEAYWRLQDSGADYHRYEFFGPVLAEMVGRADGLDVLDLGCGNGYFSRVMAQAGARVTGVDISPNQLAIARRREEADGFGILYREMDAADAAGKFEPWSFDLVTSCMALQDMPGAAQALGAAATVLRTGGRLVFGITHPCFDTPYRAWERDEDGNKLALKVAGYFDGVPMSWKWPGVAYEFSTTAHHVPISRWFGWLRAAGFVVDAIEEPVPTPEAVRRNPKLADATMVGYFMLFDAHKAGA